MRLILNCKTTRMELVGWIGEQAQGSKSFLHLQWEQKNRFSLAEISKVLRNTSHVCTFIQSQLNSANHVKHLCVDWLRSGSEIVFFSCRFTRSSFHFLKLNQQLIRSLHCSTPPVIYKWRVLFRLLAGKQKDTWRMFWLWHSNIF